LNSEEPHHENEAYHNLIKRVDICQDAYYQQYYCFSKHIHELPEVKLGLESLVQQDGVIIEALGVNFLSKNGQKDDS